MGEAKYQELSVKKAKVEGKVYKSVVRPAILFGLDTVALIKIQETDLDIQELNLLRSPLGGTKMD